MKNFLLGLWTKIKGVFAELEKKVIYIWTATWTLIETLYASTQKLIIALGEVHAALLLALAWAVYFLFAKGLLGVSADLVATLIKAVPYLVGLALVGATVILVIDLTKKK